jgi:hypothetical protein
MNLTNLDLDTMRTIVVANDLGGYGPAAERLGRTSISQWPSKCSQTMGSTVVIPVCRNNSRTRAFTPVMLRRIPLL